MFNDQLYYEIWRGCGAVIDRRDLQQLMSHFNFNMNKGVYECRPSVNEIDKDAGNHEAHIFDLANEEVGNH